MSSTKEYCLGAENHTNSWCKQLLRMYKEYNRNQQIIEDVRFTKEMIFTYHMVNTGVSTREGRNKWRELYFKCFGNIGHFKNINELEKFYDTPRTYSTRAVHDVSISIPLAAQLLIWDLL